jgi:hypothetical protein
MSCTSEESATRDSVPLSGESPGARRELTFALAAALAAGFLYCAPVFDHVENWGIQDWDQHIFYHEAARTSVASFHQVPLWNPWYCGGAPLLANPQVRILTPFFLLHLALGSVLAFKLEIPLHVAIGLIGTFLLARQSDRSRGAAALASVVFMLSTLYSLSIASGMSWPLSLAYVPWVLYFVRRAAPSFASSVAAAGALDLIYFEGSPYYFVIASMAVATYSIVETLRTRRLGPLRAGAVVLSLALGFGAVKLLPSIELLRDHPRHMQDYSGYSVVGLLTNLTDRHQLIDVREGDGPTGFWQGWTYTLPENATYIGWLPLTLAALGLWPAWHRDRTLLVVGGLFLWIGFGDRAPWNLWGWLHELPIFEFMRVAQRFRIVVLLQLAILAAYGLDLVQAHLSRHFTTKAVAKGIGIFLTVAVGFDLILVSRPIWRDAFPLAPWKTSRRSLFVQSGKSVFHDASGPIREPHARASTSSHFPAILENRGIVGCYEPIPVPRAARSQAESGYRGEAFLLRSRGAVTVTLWSPNRLQFRIDARRRDLLVVNQNYSRHWRATPGLNVVSHKGLIAIPVPRGRSTVEINYRPRSFLIGVTATSATTISTLITLFVTSRRRRR